MSPCPPVERLLAFASGELADDRAIEVESHIDSCQECRAALSNLAREGGPPPALGRYRIDTVLGSGGMGIVYRAYDPQLARPVAIKVVRRAGEDTAGRARLVREAQALARLSHPNVCHVYDVGTEGDEVWVAMELIDGVSLRQWAEQHRDGVIEVLLGAAEGIAAAHAAGLVHRDIKPENVLVTRDGRAIVTDFGLARHEDAIDPRASTLGNDPHLTATGAIAGTPAYLAPEQLLGDPIDARVDQFAWAVMAYELLTGSKPFPIIFAVRVEAIRQGLTPPPSLPPALANALVRAMAASPADRFPSMRDVIAAMRATPANADKQRKQTVVPARGRKPAVAALVVLGAGAGLVAAWQLTKDEEPKPEPIASYNRVGTATPPIMAAADAAMPPLVGSAGSATTPSAAPPSAPSEPPAIAARAAAPAPAAKKTKPDKSDPKTPKPEQQEVQATNPVTVPAPAPPTTTAQGSGGGLTPRQQAILDSLDPPYCRSCAVASVDAFCEIPYDVANPETKRRREVLDWGKVTSVGLEKGKLGDRPVTLNIITVQGQRDTYRFKDELLVGRLQTQVGALLAICPEEEDDFWQLSGGPTFKTRAVITLSAPPRLAEAAKFKALHIPDIKIAADAVNKSLRLDPARRYLVNAKVESDDGALWKMDRYWLDASAAKGANKLAPKKRFWMIVEKPDFTESVPGDKRLVVHAVQILDEIFP